METKAHSKPTSRDARVVFDGETILVDGFAPDRNPVIQPKAQSSWVQELRAEAPVANSM